MGFNQFRVLELSSIADGAKSTDQWTADANYTIKRIFIQREDGEGFSASKVWIKIGGHVYTREIVPAVVLGPDIEVSPELNIPIKNGETFSVEMENDEGVTISVFVTLELWTTP